MILFSRGDVETCCIDVALWLNAIRKRVVLLLPAYSSHNSQQAMQPFLLYDKQHLKKDLIYFIAIAGWWFSCGFCSWKEYNLCNKIKQMTSGAVEQIVRVM